MLKKKNYFHFRLQFIYLLIETRRNLKRCRCRSLCPTNKSHTYLLNVNHLILTINNNKLKILGNERKEYVLLFYICELNRIAKIKSTIIYKREKRTHTCVAIYIYRYLVHKIYNEY